MSNFQRASTRPSNTNDALDLFDKINKSNPKPQNEKKEDIIWAL